MHIDCEIAQITTLKKGMKIIIAIDDDNTPRVMQQIHNFMDKPLQVDFRVDGEEQRERLQQISPEQRKKIYALFKDISSYTGNTADNEKETMKNLFIADTHHEPFSLSNCSSDLAGDFIEWMIDFCFKNGIRLSEHPLRTLNDIERYVRMSLRHRICAVCGKPGEVHHCTGSRIGMGRNRNKISNKGKELISLCRVHHSELHSMDEESFFEKYHIHGVVYDE